MLEQQALQTAGRKLPIYENHDPVKGVLGCLWNLRVESDPESPGHFLLTADCQLSEEGAAKLRDTVGSGFSWTATQALLTNDAAPIVDVFLPFPTYKDRKALESCLHLDVPLRAGSVIRKSADPPNDALVISKFALLVAVAGHVIAPVWRRVYEDRIHGMVSRVIDHVILELGLPVIVVQPIESPSGRRGEIWFVTGLVRGDPSRPELVGPVLGRVERWSSHLWNAGFRTISRVRCRFNESRGGYEIVSVELEDGDRADVAVLDAATASPTGAGIGDEAP